MMSSCEEENQCESCEILLTLQLSQFQLDLEFRVSSSADDSPPPTQHPPVCVC